LSVWAAMACVDSVLPGPRENLRLGVPSQKAGGSQKMSLPKELNQKLQELKVQSDKARNSLSEFYTRLPNIKDSGVVITELQTHIDELIDHIVDCHSFFDTEVLSAFDDVKEEIQKLRSELEIESKNADDLETETYDLKDKIKELEGRIADITKLKVEIPNPKDYLLGRKDPNYISKMEILLGRLREALQK